MDSNAREMKRKCVCTETENGNTRTYPQPEEEQESNSHSDKEVRHDICLHNGEQESEDPLQEGKEEIGEEAQRPRGPAFQLRRHLGGCVCGRDDMSCVGVGGWVGGWVCVGET